MKKNSATMRMHACPRCGGAAYLDNPDENEWRCLQCARTVPAPAVGPRKDEARAA